MGQPPYMPPEEKQRHAVFLIANIASKMDDLKKLLEEVSHKWVYEDLIYRFYHQSFKVYALQEYTSAIADLLKSLAPNLPLNPWFVQVIAEGTGKQFRSEANEKWLEAFFHARYFLEMVCKYGKEFHEPPTIMPAGWAAVLYLFNLR